MLLRDLENYEEARGFAIECGDRALEGDLLRGIGQSHLDLGNFEQAESSYNRRMILSQEIHYPRGEVQTLAGLADCFARGGDADRASESQREALQIAQRIDDQNLVAGTSWQLGMLYRDQGRFQEAVNYMQICIDHGRSTGHPDLKADTKLLEETRALIKG